MVQQLDTYITASWDKLIVKNRLRLIDIRQNPDFVKIRLKIRELKTIS